MMKEKLLWGMFLVTEEIKSTNHSHTVEVNAKINVSDLPLSLKTHWLRWRTDKEQKFKKALCPKNCFQTHSWVCPTSVKCIISKLFTESHNLMGLYIYLIMKNKYDNAYNLEWAKDKINARGTRTGREAGYFIRTAHKMEKQMSFQRKSPSVILHT